MPLSGPRVVIASRDTEYTRLLATHGTHEQARFFLQTRGQSLDDVVRRHAAQSEALASVSRALPRSWRSARVTRDDLSRFLFEPDDLVVAVGQDGLVANVAKYLDGQPVLGLNPDRTAFDGVLARHSAEAVADLLGPVAAGRAQLEARTMVEARLDDGQRLAALNEIFVGHRSHQSARYLLAAGGRREHHSSSGVIVATGTGATGWALSINRTRAEPLAMPGPSERRLAFFVREAFPSVSTGASMLGGSLADGATLEFLSETSEGGVVFGDGLEDDRLALGWGCRVTVGIAERPLLLVTG